MAPATTTDMDNIAPACVSPNLYALGPGAAGASAGGLEGGGGGGGGGVSQQRQQRRPPLPAVPRALPPNMAPTDVSPAPSLRLPQAELLRPHGALAGYGRISELLEGIRYGDMGGRVGLLPGLRPQVMDKYVTTDNTRTRRAPHEDLSGYTAEERVARWRKRARVYSSNARQRVEQVHQELKQDVAAMRIYSTIVDDAPHVVAVLSMDIHCLVLYANKAFTAVVGHAPEELLGSSFWDVVHPEDKARLLPALGGTILTMLAPPSALPCRLLVRGVSDGPFQAPVYKPYDIRVAYGTQGLMCTLWERFA